MWINYLKSIIIVTRQLNISYFIDIDKRNKPRGRCPVKTRLNTNCCVFCGWVGSKQLIFVLPDFELYLFEGCSAKLINLASDTGVGL